MLSYDYFENKEKITYQFLKTFTPVKDWLDVRPKTNYVLIEGTGSIYKNNKSIGYYSYGTLISFGDQISGEYILAKVKGEQVFVSSNSSFGNNPAKIKSFKNNDFGDMPLNCFPTIIELSKVMEKINDNSN